MRPHGKVFDGSNSMFETQQFLWRWNVASNALWLPHFTPVRSDHLRFVTTLLKTFCSLDICCACVGTYPSYIAGVLGTYYLDTLRISQLCIARTDSPILDELYIKFPTLDVGIFELQITEAEEFPRLFAVCYYIRMCDNSFFYFHCRRACTLRMQI